MRFLKIFPSLFLKNTLDPDEISENISKFINKLLDIFIWNLNN